MECGDPVAACGVDDGGGWSAPSSALWLPRDRLSLTGSPPPHAPPERTSDASGLGQRRGEDGEQEGRRDDERKEEGRKEGLDEEQVDEGGAERGGGDDSDGGEYGGDVERLPGEILYHPDGSAYILDGRGQLSQSGEDVATPSPRLSSSHPSILHTFHIPLSLGHGNGAPHLFRVFHLRRHGNRPTSSDPAPGTSSQSKDNFPDEAGLPGARPKLIGRGDRVLMCFLCGLSFGHAHSFAVHARRRHNVAPSNEERHQLFVEHTSAILHHGNGPDNMPLLSFLEPKNNSRETEGDREKEGVTEEESEKEGENENTVSPNHPVHRGALDRCGAPCPTSTLQLTREPQGGAARGGWAQPESEGVSEEGVGVEGEGVCVEGQGGCVCEEGQSEGGCEEGVCVCVCEEGEGVCEEGEGEGGGSRSGCGRSSAEVALSTPLCVQPAPHPPDRPASFNCPSPPAGPRKPAADECANQETAAMATEPNEPSERRNAIATAPNDSLETEGDGRAARSTPPAHPSRATHAPLGPEETPGETGSVESLGSAGLGCVPSPYGQGGVAQSRNSCKTLKCPRCNWHYKYQQTLEAHMREKHAEPEGTACPFCSSGHSHPRLARGESYTCGYKPFQCQVCQYSTTTKGNLSIHMQSDKHLNNMHSLQGGAAESGLSHAAQTAASPCQAPPQAGGACASPSPSKPRPHPSWRCEVCDYETAVARNLRIHMTSEKHGHNLLLLQQSLALTRRRTDPPTRAPALRHPDPPAGPLPRRLFACGVWCGFSSDGLEALARHLAAPRALPDSDWRSTAGDAHLCKLCQYSTPLRANFQLHCQTDKHLQRLQLAAHLREATRHHGNQAEGGGETEEEEAWRLRCVATGNQVRVRCNACEYEAGSMEKLKLHTLNSRHKNSLKLYQYLQQLQGSDPGSQWLCCMLCGYSTHCSLSMVQHSNSLSHQRGAGLRRLQQIQKGSQDEEEELNAIYTTRKSPTQDNGELSVVEEASDSGADQEGQTKEGPGGEDSDLTTGAEPPPPERGEHRATPPQAKRSLSGPGEADGRAEQDGTAEQVLRCPFCCFAHTDLGHLRAHAMSQHALQPTLCCPLCQDTLSSVALLHTHLTHLHSVANDCTHKLINMVIASDVLPDSMFVPVPPSARSNTLNANPEPSTNGTEGADETSLAPPLSEGHKSCSRSDAEDAESSKENTASSPSLQRGSSKVLTSSTALQTHSSQSHNQVAQTPVSDRHVYKYRCTQCSLAFKTLEKLQLHSQYHVIRAATMCSLCHRSFRSMQALRRHLETSHLELSEAQVQQLYGKLLLNDDPLGSGHQTLCEEQGLPGDQGGRDDEESDQEEKPSPTGSDSGSGQEESTLDLKRSILPLRRSSNITMEKFLDPTRPFKCTVCKESFTQKNILLVHYNSVSHLHRVKRSLQDPSAGLPESSSSTDHKPYKCCICCVAYSQSSTLEIHMRSVLHQTKARAAKLDQTTAGPANTSPLPGKVASSVGSTSSPPVLKSVTTTNLSFTPSQPNLHQIPESTSAPANCTTSFPLSSETHDAKRKRLADIIASTAQQQQQKLLQQQLAQAQAQLRQEFHQKAALFQSHLFNPALLQRFPMATEALLPLQQQQQLLLPFLIPGGEFHLNPELKLNTPGLNLSPAKPSPSKVPTGPIGMDELSSPHQQMHKQGHPAQPAPQPLPGENISASDQTTGMTSNHETQNVRDEEDQIVKSEKMDDLTCDDKLSDTASKDMTSFDEEMDLSRELYSGFPLPRVSHDAPENASRALLENIGFELVVQFNENKQQYQRKLADLGPNEQSVSVDEEVDHPEEFERLECSSCGKLFSNMLILKSHQEHIHQTIFSIQSLEKFAKDYREQYDKLFPLRPATPEMIPSSAAPTSALVPPPPPPPSTQPSQPSPTPSTPTSTPSATPPVVSTLQPKAPVTPIHLPLDLPLFPPLIMHPMPLQTIPAPVAAQRPPLDVAVTQDMAHLYQQQLSPALLQQQGKRPRTRITDDQLRILRQYFDINNSPNEDQILEMANKSGLPQKVIKHWFRNTLFKERQRNKDSPYNFNNPPITTLEDVKVEPKPLSPEPLKQESYGSRRSSRTRFTDHQLRVLQDFFDANAYPKDDEFEQLSSLLNLSTRVIVVWFQNARQKARKNLENQGDGGKEGERLSNDRYLRTSNNNYQCKKCSMVFQRIFDLINHQKKLCYKDEDEDVSYDSYNEDYFDPKYEDHSPPRLSSLTPTPSCSGLPSNSEPNNTSRLPDNEAPPSGHAPDSLSGNPKPSSESACESQLDQSSLSTLVEKQQTQEEQPKPQSEEKVRTWPSTPKSRSPSPVPQQQQSTPSVSQTSPAPSQDSRASLNPLLTPGSLSSQKLPQQLTPYHCIQCKLSFPSFEHWQEHQQLHFLSAQSPFTPPQFRERPLDLSFMMFDPSNPLMASQLLAGAFLQIPPGNAAPSPVIPEPSLKRKLEEKAGCSPLESEWENSGEDQQRDKRMRTTITPEQLEVLYQKYLLDSNPTRKMLDDISSEVGLKKRVVQVWFQNTRARERKGQFRALGPAQAHRRCPFCRALFKAQTALDAHIRSRHWHEAKSAGYSLTSSAAHDQEGLQTKVDPQDFPSYSHFSHLPSGDGLPFPLSPISKNVDLSLPQPHLSPKAAKVDTTDDFDSPPSFMAQQTFEHLKPNNSESSSNAMGHNGSAASDEQSYSEAKHKSSDLLSSIERDACSEGDDKMSVGLVSPGMSFSARDFECDMVVDCSESSSLTDPASPSTGGDRQGQKRYRTQLTDLQVKVLKACCNDYKTPTMMECETLGNNIGLAKRVVQVWFQNARAKEKKAKLSLAKQFGGETSSTERPKTECTLCGIKYSGSLSLRDHVFSQQHLANVKEALGGQMDKEREYMDSGTVRQLMAQQEVERLRNASEVLGLAQTLQKRGGLDQTALQSLNLPSAYSGLQMHAAVLPGVSGTSLGGLASMKSGASDLSSIGVTNKIPASSDAPDDGIHIAADPASSPKTPSIVQPPPSKENDTENKDKLRGKFEKTPASSLCHPNPANKEKTDVSTPTPTPNLGKDFLMDPAQLQALQVAMATDPTALLTSPLLPCLAPGFPPYFPPQIPGALPGGLLQPLYGMEGMFPFGHPLPQPLMSSGSILQQYQQYQHNLKEALQQQRRQLQQKQQPPQKPKAGQTPIQDLSGTKEPVLVSSRTEEEQSSHTTPLLPMETLPSKSVEMDDAFLSSQRIVSRADFGARGQDGHLFDCLACDVSLAGKEDLYRHLESPEHKRRTAERPNAKEHATPLLPHPAACPPARHTTPTSLPNPPFSPRETSARPSSPACSSSPPPYSAPNRHCPRSPSLSRALPGDSDPPSSSSSTLPPKTASSLTVTSSPAGFAADCSSPTTRECWSELP